MCCGLSRAEPVRGSSGKNENFSQNPGKRQQMLMMLEGLGLKAGQAPADAHDARGFGSESPGKRQLMLMMLEGLGLQAWASAS